MAPRRTTPSKATWPQAATVLHALGPEMLVLMDELSATLFCAKDLTGRYVAVNQAFVNRTGERSRRAVIGRRSQDLFAPHLAEHYSLQDAAVLTSGQPVRHLLELVARPGGMPGWFLTAKLPVRAAGAVVGLVSVSQSLASCDPAAVSSLTRVVDLTHDRFAERITVADLARAAGCSPSTLDRRMHKVFSLSPQQFVLRTRIDHAAALLTTGSLTIAQVATAAGFYDQAVFTRTFGRLTGQTPAQFRRSPR